MARIRGKRNREAIGETDAALRLQLHHTLASPPQEVATLPSTHRYPTRHSNAVPNQCSSATPLRYPTQRQIGTPRNSPFLNGARRVILERKDNACPLKKKKQAFEECTSKLPHQNQGSNATSRHSSPCPKKGKTLRSPSNSVGLESEDWSAPISKDVLDMAKLTSELLSQSQRPEKIQPSASLFPSPQELIENHLPREEANVGLTAISNVLEKTATSHVGKNSRLSESSINLTEMALMVNGKFPDDEEVESAIDPALVTVNGYRVKEELAPLLRDIFKQHGDITRDCILESSKVRASFLEMACCIYQKLNWTKLLEITPIEIKEMLSLVNDLERARVDVKWLRQLLNELSDLMHVLTEYSTLKENKERHIKLIERKEKQLDDFEDELRGLQNKISSAKDELVEMKTNKEEIDKRFEDAKKKAKALHKRSSG